MVKITLAICTYNRAEYLDLCLESITKQTIDNYHFKVLVVDNNSIDNTINIFNKYKKKYSNFRIVKETKIGLSNARNRAIKETDTEWIAYIDDDAILFENYVEIVLKTIKKYNFVCFGGNYIAKYLETKPKWIDSTFGSSQNNIKKIKRIYFDNIICGCNMVFNKAILIKIGGFPDNLGMKGSKIGYGEENYVQKKILEMNLPVGFQPELKIYHIVQPYKYKLTWHLKKIYAHGRARESINNKGTSRFILFYYLIKNIAKTILFIPLYLLKLNKKDYYWQNFVLDVSNSILYNIGRINVLLIFI